MRPKSRGEFIRSKRALPAPDTARFAKQLRIALAAKGWKAAELARQLGVSRQLAASWTRGRSVPAGATAARLPKLLDVESAWLFPTGAGMPEREPGLPQDARSPSSRSAGRSVASVSIRAVEAQEAARRGFQVLAGRIARTIQQTIVGNELGYTVKSRGQLADSLEIFAHDLDERCGEKVCGDIWEVVAWLRKPPEKFTAR